MKGMGMLMNNTIRGIVAVLAGWVLIAAGADQAIAQTDYSARGATSRLSIGASVNPGFSVPIGSLDSTEEAALGFAFHAGINVTYPVSTDIRVFANAGFDTRNLGAKKGDALEATIYNASYFYIEPGFAVSALRISLNIGLPMGASISPPEGESQELDSDVLETLIEPRIGALLVLIDDADYWLGLSVDGGFPVNKLFKEEYFTPELSRVPETTPLSAHIGVTFQFAIPGT